MASTWLPKQHLKLVEGAVKKIPTKLPPGPFKPLWESLQANYKVPEQYDKTCLYDTYDITTLHSRGQNAVGVLLSNGMYLVKKGGRYAKFQHSFGHLHKNINTSLTVM